MRHIRVPSNHAGLVLTVSLLATACSPAAPRDEPQSGSEAPRAATTLLSEVAEVLRAVNPAIENVRILDLAPLERGAADYLVLAHGYADDLGDPPNWDNELFVAIAFDETLVGNVGVFTRLPAQNWRGWDMWIEEVGRDSIVFARQSRTYGGDPVLTSFPIAGSVIE